MKTGNGRFDYVKYDETAQGLQTYFKVECQNLESAINAIGPAASTVLRGDDIQKLARSKAAALTKLEEFYMWAGKAIRDDQVCRNGSAQLQEERGNS